MSPNRWKIGRASVIRVVEIEAPFPGTATPHIAEFLRALGDLRVRSIELTRYEVTSKRDVF